MGKRFFSTTTTTTTSTEGRHMWYFGIGATLTVVAWLSFVQYTAAGLLFFKEKMSQPSYFCVDATLLHMAESEQATARPRFRVVELLEPTPFWGTVRIAPVPPFEINTHDPVHEDIFISGSVHAPGGRQGPWDPYIWDVFVRMLGSSTTGPPLLVLDVGANLGYFTLMAAALGHRVIAFEPMGHNVARLRSSIARNKGFAQRITLYQNAVSHTSNAAVALRATHSTNQGNGQIVALGTSKEMHLVDTVRLDDLHLQEPVALMKIDVEGFETAVLDGARTLICAHQVHAIVLELSDATRQNVDCSVRRMLAFMEASGYELSDVVAGAPRLSAHSTPLEAFPPNVLMTLKNPLAECPLHLNNKKGSF